MKVHLISFATEHYYAASMNLIKMAEESGFFASVKVYTPEDIPAFRSRHADFLASNPKGYGYWLWKPYIMMKALEEKTHGDLILYVDVATSILGCTADRLESIVIDEVKYRQRRRAAAWSQFLGLARDNGALFFEYHNKIGVWCKMDLLIAADAVSLAEEKEIIPGAFFAIVNDRNMAFFSEVYEFMCADYHRIDDSPSVEKELPCFYEHRHDQSVFSLLIRQKMADCVRPHEEGLFDGEFSPFTFRTNHYPK